jgi:dihydroneopterin triphosphate diphosphatase
MKISDYAFMIQPSHTVCFIVRFIDGRSEYLLMHRCGEYLKGNWQMVTGGINQGMETAWQAALRELKEETGLTPQAFYTVDQIESFYEFNLDKILFGPIFLAIVDPSQEVQLSPLEHDRYVWKPYEEALDYLQFANQRRILNYIEERYVQRKPDPFFAVPFHECPINT